MIASYFVVVLCKVDFCGDRPTCVLVSFLLTLFLVLSDDVDAC